MACVQVLEPGYRGKTKDPRICTDSRIKLLGRAVTNKDELDKNIAALDGTEQQQAGRLMASEKRRATQTENTSEATFDTKMKVKSLYGTGGKEIANKKTTNNQRKALQNNPGHVGQSKEQERCKEQRETDPNHSLEASESRVDYDRNRRNT